jgi:hypothetical protein
MAQQLSIQNITTFTKKEIPLYVKSFINPLLKGTSVSKGVALEPYLPFHCQKKPITNFSFIN